MNKDRVSVAGPKLMTLDEYDYATHRWGVRPFELPNSDEYLYDIDNISMAMVGAFDAYGSNTFFEEACQPSLSGGYVAEDAECFGVGNCVADSQDRCPGIRYSDRRVQEWPL